jgi:hypothetical protein
MSKLLLLNGSIGLASDLAVAFDDETLDSEMISIVTGDEDNEDDDNTIGASGNNPFGLTRFRRREDSVGETTTSLVRPKENR